MAGQCSFKCPGNCSTVMPSMPGLPLLDFTRLKAYPPLPSVWAFAACTATTPAADSCRMVRVNRSTLSPDSGTCGRPPAIRLTAFNAQPPNLPPALLMDVDFAAIGQLVQRRRPHIRFLSIGSRLCSTLPSDPASRRQPLRFAITSPPSGCEEDFHLQAVIHARRTSRGSPADSRASQREEEGA